MIAKDSQCNVVTVKDQKYETPSIELLSVVLNYPEIFPNDFLRIPPKWEIDFCIDLL